MSKSPKIVEAWKHNVRGCTEGAAVLFDDGTYDFGVRLDAADSWAAERGQVIEWPEGYGRAVVRDKPKPTPLPERWMDVYPVGAFYDLPSRVDADKETPSTPRIATVHWWTDDDGIDHAEVIRP